MFVGPEGEEGLVEDVAAGEVRLLLVLVAHILSRVFVDVEPGGVGL